MSLGDDPFRKRDHRPAGNAGEQEQQQGAAAGQPYGQQPPPYGQQPPPYGQQPPPYGQQQYQQPYGQPYGQGGFPPPYGSPYPPAYGQPAGTPPPGHLGWAITAVIFFWPLAIAAFINYSRVESLWYRGDWAGSQRASEAVKRYGVIALCIGLAIIVLYIGLAATVIGTGASSTRICGPGGC